MPRQKRRAQSSRGEDKRQKKSCADQPTQVGDREEIDLTTPPPIHFPAPPALGTNMHASSVEATIVKRYAELLNSSKACQLYQLGQTPLHIQNLIVSLKRYPDSTAKELEEGLLNGFPLHYEGPRYFRDSPNLLSAKQLPEILQDKIIKEIQAGRVAGPFLDRPFSTLQISPVGLVPKKGGDFRLIHHLSYPEGKSINSNIDEQHCSVSYSNIDQAAKMIFTLGSGCRLSKSDVKSAFRLLPISPKDFDLLGFKVQVRSPGGPMTYYFYDKMLPFGSSISCALWEKFASFLHWAVVTASHNSHIQHYLDDFLFGEPAINKSGHTLQSFKDVCKTFGIPVALDKTCPPTTCITFLGIEFDTIKMVMRLPKDKLVELKQRISQILNSKKVTLKVMQSLLGSLNFACRVIAPGRAFCRRLINATIGIKKPHHKIRVSGDMKKDLNMWLQFLTSYNGVTLISDPSWFSNTELHLYTDSAGGPSGGFGIYFAGHWSQGTWPASWVEEGLVSDMTFLEFFPVVAAIVTWAEYFRNKNILFHIDNQAVIYIIRTQTCKSGRVMNLVRHLLLVMLQNNISIKATYIPSSKNIIADALSRSQWGRFWRAAPEADKQPTKIPAYLWAI